MRRGAMLGISIAVSCAAGICAAEIVGRSLVVRDKLGSMCGRGHLIAVVHSRGIYELDVERTVSEANYLAGADDKAGVNAKSESALMNLIANAALLAHADREKISRGVLKRELNLIRWQFRDEKTWAQALHGSGFLTPTLWRLLENDLRARQWISKQIAPEIEVTEAECRRFYESHSEDFFSPERRRVSHLFLAAPPETAPEIVESKQAAIQGLSVRLAAGEDFAALVAENSEDEATKLRGGDLGYISATRMPPDFVEAALKLHPGDTGKPLRTRLGFHILKLTDVQPPRQKTFDEVRGEIAIELANQKRAAAAQKLIGDLACQAAYLRPL